MELNLNDLQPKEAVFELSGKPGAKLTLRKITLRVQIWLDEKYGAENLQKIFKNQNMKEISEICFFILKDKSPFNDENGVPSEELFQDAIEGLQDRVVIFKALMETVGISQPLLDKISKEYDEDQKKKGLIGDPSTTSLPQNTDTP